MKDAKTIHEEGHVNCICEWDGDVDTDGTQHSHQKLVAGCTATHGYVECPECGGFPWTPIVAMVYGELEMRCVACLAEDTEIGNG